MSVPATGEMERITREIHTLEAHAVERALSAVEFKIEIGRRLQRAKEILPHGEFMPWASREFGWNPRHVQKHMELARNAPRVAHLPPEASLRAALAAIAEADREANYEPREGELPGPARYVLSLVWPGGEEISVSLRAPMAEELMRRELAAAKLLVQSRAA